MTRGEDKRDLGGFLAEMQRAQRMRKQENGEASHLAPTGRHVYSSAESLYAQAPAGRHVYHVSAASSESKTYCRIYIEMLMPVFRPSGAACL